MLRNTFRKAFLGVSEEPLGVRGGSAGVIDPRGFVFRTFCLPGTAGEKRWLPSLMTGARKYSGHVGSVS